MNPLLFGIVTAGTLLEMDAFLFDLINQSWAHPVLDRLMPVLSSLDLWRPLLFAAVIHLLIFGGMSGRRFLLVLSVGLVIGDGLFAHTLKHAVGRLRPRDVREGAIVRSLAPGEPKWLHMMEPPVLVVCHPGKEKASHGNSFPSGHVVNLFTLATVAFAFRRFAGIFVGMAGLLMAWSRIYCGAHWPSDIPPSIVIGIVSGLASIWIIGRVLPWFVRKLDPSGGGRWPYLGIAPSDAPPQ